MGGDLERKARELAGMYPQIQQQIDESQRVRQQQIEMRQRQIDESNRKFSEELQKVYKKREEEETGYSIIASLIGSLPGTIIGCSVGIKLYEELKHMGADLASKSSLVLGVSLFMGTIFAAGYAGRVIYRHTH
ncbi:hypothetical protein HYU13_05070 [Candidatus Woesearchaeota archaeon]|nr:hypothetical protein [Candidatus Woesearchaeota archaeon]